MARGRQSIVLLAAFFAVGFVIPPLTAAAGPGSMGGGAGGYGAGASGNALVGGSIVAPPPSTDDIPLDFRERFLAASGDTNRLTAPDAIRAGLIIDPHVFAAIDRDRRGVITLEDVRRFVRDGHGEIGSR